MDYREYAKKLREAGERLPAAVAMPVFRRRAIRIIQGAIQNSPVNFGTLRRGWHLTIGSPSKADIEGGESDSAILEAATKALEGMQLGEGAWIQNNVPYAAVYEYGLFKPTDPGPSKATHVPPTRRKRVAGRILISGGFHVSAPNGMLADAVQQVAEAARAGQL